MNSSAINKSNSEDNFRDAELDAPLKESNTQSAKQDIIIEQKPVSEPKYKVGQTVYFYKNDEVIESKITFLDSIGLKIEYTDVLKDKTKTKFIAFDKVLLEKP